MKKRIGTAFCLFLTVLSGCGRASDVYFQESAMPTEETETAFVPDEAADGTEHTAECYVYVCGAVACPGVYMLPAGSRIYEAVLMAGGLTADACEEGINQAEKVVDGQMIRVPTTEEASLKEEQAQPAEEAADGRVNLNTADAAELMTLPGIGASKAESILAYRKEAGGFASVEEIMNITGIKEGVYSKIKDYITVN